MYNVVAVHDRRNPKVLEKTALVSTRDQQVLVREQVQVREQVPDRKQVLHREQVLDR